MKRIMSFVVALMMVCLASGCSEEAPAPTQPPKMDVSGQYFLNENEEAVIPVAEAKENPTNNRVFYQIFVGSFSDSNGDGIGDLQGIINRFDYLNDGDPNSGVSLGVEGIWLSPIFKSPTYHKYDVADYYKIDPQFGTMEDLQALIDLCHSRDVQIILDLPINHTSSANIWFVRFAASHQDKNPAGTYYDFYTCVDEPVGGRAFMKIKDTPSYYECNFSSEMPELNFDNPQVRQAVVDVAKFYLDMGIDGFRFDAAKYIYFGDEPKNAEFWQWYMNELRTLKPDIYTVAEVWDSDGVTFPYFAATNCFNFTMAQTGGRIDETAKAGDVNKFTAYVSQYIQQIQSRNPNAMPVSFIANHDTDRAAGFLTLASGQAKVGANLLLLMPGSSFIYYGEEIGIKGSRGGASTDANRRLAMLWGDEDTVRNPVGTTYSSEQSNGTVVSQRADGTSLYNHYKQVIAARKANPEIASGTYTALKLTDTKLGGFISSLEDSAVMVLHNTSRSSVTVDIRQITDQQFTQLVAVLGVESAQLEGTQLTIGGQTSVILR